MPVELQPGRTHFAVDSDYAKQISSVGTASTKTDKMCPNGSVPLLLERSDSYLDSEVNSDVTFLVGQGSDLSRVPGHRSVLAAASPVFRAMFEGTLADGPIVTITDVDRRAFDNLLRYMYGEEVQLRSVGTALTTLYAAHKYQSEGLERLCISYLSTHLDTSCVLDIYHDMLYYNNYSDTLSLATMQHDWTPSAPPLDTVSSSNILQTSNSTVPAQAKTSSNNTPISSVYAELLNKCLQYIDYYADIVLQQEQLEELNEQELRSIAERDTLGISSEKMLFKALERWCNCKCKCNQWELSPEKRRKALGKDLLFTVRFLQMTSEEFMSGPMKSKLLDQKEAHILLQTILNHKEIEKAPKYLEDVLPALRRPRQKPAILDSSFDSAQSSRRSSKTSRDSVSGWSSKSAKKQLRKQRRQLRAEQRNLEERKPNLTDYFFSCVACIFD